MEFFPLNAVDAGFSLCIPVILVMFLMKKRGFSSENYSLLIAKKIIDLKIHVVVVVLLLTF